MPQGSIRCVLWVVPAGPKPSTLVKGLNRRGVIVCSVWDALLVMVELDAAATDLRNFESTTIHLGVVSELAGQA